MPDFAGLPRNNGKIWRHFNAVRARLLPADRLPLTLRGAKNRSSYNWSFSACWKNTLVAALTCRICTEFSSRWRSRNVARKLGGKKTKNEHLRVSCFWRICGRRKPRRATKALGESRRSEIYCFFVSLRGFTFPQERHALPSRLRFLASRFRLSEVTLPEIRRISRNRKSSHVGWLNNWTEPRCRMEHAYR